MTSSRLRRREVLVAVSAGYVTLSGCVGSDSSRDKDSAIWNVETHGIEGDGTTDVGENVQDVLNQVNEAGGGVVYFPPDGISLSKHR